MRAIAAILIAAACAIMQGCVPVVATGVGAGVVAAEDRRTLGTQAVDKDIELRAESRISAAHKSAHVNVSSFNRWVLLTGEAPTEEARRDIERLVRAVDNVRSITNELTVAAASALQARAADSFITSKVKARFLDASKFNAVHVRVVTEAKVVYLMGLVRRQEAKDAIDVARTTEGVSKVVTVFEYLD